MSTRSCFSALPLLCVLLCTVTCVPLKEGAEPGECYDRADNDGNGLFDCDDEGCNGISPCAVAGIPGTLEDAVECDAGDEALVRRLVPQLWGRQPESIREVDLLVQVIEQGGRSTLVRAMMGSEEFAVRWLEVIKDLLHVNRVGDRSGIGCTSVDEEVLGDPTALIGNPELAAFVRDNSPDGPQYSEEWTLNDLIFSSLALDDLSPVFRAQLFGQLGSRLINLENEGAERSWRTAHATIFETSYLNRRMVCLQCHNSEYSVTDAADPEDDRTWQVPGYFEKALYGDSAGRPIQDLAAFFRIEGVLALQYYPEGVYRPGLHWGHGDGFHPWGMSARCGSFILPSEMEEDPEGWSGYFIEAVDDRPSIWHLERLLRDGFEELRGSGLASANPSNVDGEFALAWMVGMRVAERVWLEITGRPLTTPFFFPRNRYQRDLLVYLTDAFVGNGYSLNSLVEAIVLHPYFNPGLPERCEELDTAYYMAPVFDPWVVDHDVEELRLNTPGDLVQRLPPRVLMDATISALDWPDFDREVEAIWVNPALDPDHAHDDGGNPVDDEGNPLGEPSPINEDGFPLSPVYSFEIGIGLFLLDSSTGFRNNNLGESLTWEETLGGCVEPFSAVGGSPDWLDTVVAEAPPEQPIGDLVLALKDRLTARPVIESSEEGQLLELLLGHPLDTPVGTLEDSTAPLRRVCAALLSSPDFQFAGAPGGDLVGTLAPFVPTGASSSDLCARMVNDLFEPGAASCTAAGRIQLDG